ncbi:MAG: outer membrane beta-barrel protein, partial [Bacteroidota bacterium]
MQNKDLDKIIGDKLGNLDVPYRAGSWDALEQKLDATNAEESFDDNVRRKLSDIEMSYQPTYWNLLAHRLEQESVLRHQLIRYKASELLLVFLILITFVQFFPNKTSKYEALEATNIANKEQITFSPTISESNQLTETDVPLTTSGNIFVPPTDDAAQAFLANSDVPNRTIIPLVALEENQAELIASNKVTDHSIESIKARLTEIGISNSEGLIAALAVDEDIPLLENDLLAQITITKTPFKKKKHFRLGIYANSNVDHIKTPYDEIFDLDPRSQNALGYGGGISFGWRGRRMEIETGIAYNRKRYAPTDNSAVRYGDKIEDLINMEIDVVQIPLQLHYNFLQKEEWHFYATAGMSLNLAVQSNYDVYAAPAQALNVYTGAHSQQKVILSQNQQKLFDANSEPSPNPKSYQLRQKKFSDGLFHGGKFKDESYYTFNLGFGIERELDERFSLFAQPTYRHDIYSISGGLGPNKDGISTM